MSKRGILTSLTEQILQILPANGVRKLIPVSWIQTDFSGLPIIYSHWRHKFDDQLQEYHHLGGRLPEDLGIH